RRMPHRRDLTPVPRPCAARGSRYRPHETRNCAGEPDMTDETCILTTKDQLILEAMVRRRDVASGDHLQLLQRKLEAARIVLSSDVPPTVATMSSRVLYRIDGSEAAARIISFDHA